MSPSRVCLLTSLASLTSLVAGALIAPLPPLSYAAAPRPPASTTCGRDTDPAWAPASTRFDEADGYDPYAGNGYLAHRVPATGAGYAASDRKTGWPLFTPRYDGAFVSGLFGRDKNLAEGREVIAALPSWTTLDVRVGNETYGSGTPRAGSRTTAEPCSCAAVWCVRRCAGPRPTDERPT